MPRLLITITALFGLIMGAAGAIGISTRPAHAAGRASIADIPLPPRARIQGDGTYRAAQSYRKTVVYFERYLRRQGLAHERVPTYEVRGVMVTRFLSSSPRSRWLAIHVYKISGMTHVFIVPRAPAAAMPAAAPADPPAAAPAKSASKP